MSPQTRTPSACASVTATHQSNSHVRTRTFVKFFLQRIVDTPSSSGRPSKCTCSEPESKTVDNHKNNSLRNLGKSKCWDKYQDGIIEIKRMTMDIYNIRVPTRK